MSANSINVPKIRAAVFDMGGVILAGGPSDVREFGLRAGLDRETWSRLRAEIFGDEGPWARIERGEIDYDTFCGYMRDRIITAGGTVSLEESFHFMGNRSEEAQRARVRHEVCNGIKAIRKRIPTALLTNNIKEWRPTWSGILDVKGMFDVVIDSSDIGMRKPEARIYEYTRERLEVAHEEVFFVDDLGRNLKGARALGWQTFLYEDTNTVVGLLDAVARGV